MNFIKSYMLICSLLVMGAEKMYSQTSYTVIKPDVNAQQFFSGMSSDNNLHTGQLSLSIPLFTVSAKGIDIPITLNFGTAGVNNESESSSVGLGWSLMAGGVITHTIKGTDDRGEFFPIPGRYQEGYLEAKVNEEQSYPGGSNITTNILYNYSNGRGLPDRFSYSFPGYSGDVYFNSNGTTTLYPDVSCKFEATPQGFKITDFNGVIYLFETTANTSDNVVSWFLSEIRTLEGGVITFSYADENSRVLSSPLQPIHSSTNSKRITRIDYQYGYLVFNSSSRVDRYFSGVAEDSKRISSIEQYDSANNLIKGYELDNNHYFVNNTIYLNNYYDKRLRLNSVKPYGNNRAFTPPYIFDYDYKFLYPKDSRNPNVLTIPVNTWATNPFSLALPDRFYGGSPTCEEGILTDTETPTNIPTYLRHHSDNISPDRDDYFCMKEIVYPSGGGESYYYEPHGYNKLGYSNEEPWIASLLKGKRLSKKVIWENKQNIGASPIEVEYKYNKGVLTTPTVYSTVSYENTYVAGSSEVMFSAGLKTTTRPQNNEPSSVVYYTEIEEVFKSATGTNGKKISYYDPVFLYPPQNYIYTNYEPISNFSSSNLVSLSNTLGGKELYNVYGKPGCSTYSQSIHSYLFYPLGEFMVYDIMKGKVIKEVVLDANDNIVSKTENEYARAFNYDYGLNIERYHKGYIGGGNNDNGNPAYLFLISRSTNFYGCASLTKTTTTNYYPRSVGQLDSLTTVQNFNYLSPGLLASSSVVHTDGKELVTRNVFPQELQFQTTSNLTAQASSLKQLTEKNIYVPVQTTVQNGTEFISGSYKTFKTLSGGAVVVDTENSLVPQRGISVSDPYINTSGTIVQNTGFELERTYSSYDQKINPTTLVSKSGVAEALYWGHAGQYITARIQNYSQTQLDSNSTLKQQLTQLDNYKLINSSNQAAFIACNQAIRNSLPSNTTITTYTYKPLVGVTSITDSKGDTTYFEYDSFNRLKQVKDHNSNILSATEYHYKNQ